MKTLQALLNSKGRDYFPESAIARFQKQSDELGSVVGEANAKARAQLGADATDDAVAMRTALLFLKAVGVIPAKPQKPSTEGAEGTEAPRMAGGEMAGHE